MRSDHKLNPIWGLVQLAHAYMDYWMPCLVVLTFPFWLLPVLTFLFLSKTLSFLRYLFTMVQSVMNPHQIPEVGYAILKGNGRYLREDSDKVLVNQFYDYTVRRISLAS